MSVLTERLHQFVLWVSRAMALLGGVVLAGLITMVCLSIMGRTINDLAHAALDAQVLTALSQWVIDTGISAIRGDFELVEAGMAFCIFAFLPWCQVTAGHASVDVLAARLPGAMRRGLEAAIAVLFAVALVLVAMQLDLGMERKIRSGQTTQLLQMPIWWAYAVSLCGAVLSAAVAIYLAFWRVVEAIMGRPILPVRDIHT
ncbi:MAG: TRAP transporter small permease [Pelagimonas sp.]|jgi:TRAP-type C4-dicarboxylate transport system permease small subunit|nr:TRAP transporter small permease [Pelagimonas sp.]